MHCLYKICPVDTMFVNHLVDPDPEVEIFLKKKGQQKKGELIFR